MKSGKLLNRIHKRIFLQFVLALIIIGGCSLQLISPYDADTQRSTFECAKMVDQFYGKILETDAQNRQYTKFADQYTTIESELRSLVLRNKVRKLNEDSVNISQQILALWQKYKARHKTDDTYSTGNAELDRDRFARLFAYAVRAEDAKKP